MNNIICPFCEHSFDANSYEIGECPLCNKGYYWDERCTEDYSDCWDEVHWYDHD